MPFDIPDVRVRPGRFLTQPLRNARAAIEAVKTVSDRGTTTASNVQQTQQSRGTVRDHAYVLTGNVQSMTYETQLLAMIPA